MISFRVSRKALLSWNFNWVGVRSHLSKFIYLMYRHSVCSLTIWSIKVYSAVFKGSFKVKKYEKTYFYSYLSINLTRLLIFAFCLYVLYFRRFCSSYVLRFQCFIRLYWGQNNLSFCLYLNEDNQSIDAFYWSSMDFISSI